MTFPPHHSHFSSPFSLQNKTMYNHNHGYGPSNLAEKDRKMSQKQENSYSNWYNHNHNQDAMRSDNSGANSSPVWKNSPSASHPLLSHHSLSPDSRTEAIIRGRWELMEMVKNMPESSYELSLKDIVEHQRAETQSPKKENESSVDKNQSLHQRAKMKREDQSKKIDRNLSFENKGMFLNMVFPVSLKSKKKNKFGGTKVSQGERDWWKKKFRGSSDSDSSRTSGNSGSSGGDTGGRKTRGFLTVCWPFLHSRGSKSEE